jgi:hypothetical protein
MEANETLLQLDEKPASNTTLRLSSEQSEGPAAALPLQLFLLLPLFLQLLLLFLFVIPEGNLLLSLSFSQFRKPANTQKTQRSAIKSNMSKNSGKLMLADSEPRITVSPVARRAATLKAMAMR